MEEEEDEFAAGPGSERLAYLFSMEGLPVHDSNRALKYVAPKQPKRIEGTNPVSRGKSTSQLVVIHAVAVNAFRFNDGKYIGVGKVGFALIGNKDVFEYQLVLYTGKQQHLCCSKIGRDSKLILQRNRYAIFYDENKQTWSVMFPSDDSLSEFAKHVTFARMDSIERKQLVFQDNKACDSDTEAEVEATDCVELKYKAWLVDDAFRLGQAYDQTEKPWRLKLTTVGSQWQQCLLHMRPGSQRFVLIPQDMKQDFAEITEKAVCYDSTLMFAIEFELIRIKTRDNRERNPSVSSTIMAPTEEVPTRSEMPTNEKEGNESEISVPRKSSRNEIMSRVAKVGTRLFAPQVKDTETTVTPDDGFNANESQVDSIPNDEEVGSKPLPKPRSNTCPQPLVHPMEAKTTITASASATISNAAISGHTMAYPIMSSSSSSAPFQPYTFGQSSGQGIDPIVSLMLSENRTNCTELKLTAEKVYAKIENLSAKIDEMKNASGSCANILPSFGSNAFSIDSAFLLASIQRIVDENSSLKKEVTEKTCKLQTSNEMVCDLLQQQAGESKHLHQELDLIKDLKSREAAATAEASRLTQQVATLSVENERLREESQTFKDELKSRRVAQGPGPVELPADTYMSKFEFSAQIKKTMNTLYRMLGTDLERSGDTLSSSEVLHLIADNIRTVTGKVLGANVSSSPFHRAIVGSVDETDLELAATEASGASLSGDTEKAISSDNDTEVIDSGNVLLKSEETTANSEG